MVVAATLVFLKFPRHEDERRLLAEYAEDAGGVRRRALTA